MFKHGTRVGIMSIALVVLAVIPVLAALSFIPGLPDQVAMKVSQTGEVQRYGSKYELALAPVLCFAFSLMAYANSGKQAAMHKDSPAMAQMTRERFLRNGIVVAVVLNVVSYVVIYMAVTGHGVGL